MQEVGFRVLELENFKNYKKKTRFEWSAKLSLLVGLNGVGKSSVVDAIQFACCFPKYGCSTKVNNLRKKICNSVDLDPENTSETWVEMTLVIKSSQVIFRRTADYGNSVQRYCINGKEVTSDIYTRLLLQCNIDPAYNTFIIEQNCIEELVMKSPDDLRLLFEHLSGSEQYKANYERLKSQLQFLESETYELKKQIRFQVKLKKSIETKIKEKAAICELMDKYKSCERDYYFTKLYGVDQSIENLTKERDVLIKACEITGNLKNSSEKEMQSLQTKSAKENDFLARNKGELEDLKLDFLKQSTKKAQLEDLIQQHKDKLQKIQDNLKNAEKKEQSSERILDDLKKQKIEIESERNFFTSQSQKSSVNLNDDQNELYLQLKSEALKKCSHNLSLIIATKRDQSQLQDKIDDFDVLEKLHNEKIKRTKSMLQEINLKEQNINIKINETKHEYKNVKTNMDELMKQIVLLVETQKDLLIKVDKTETIINEEKQTKSEAMYSSQKQQVIEKLKSHCNGVHDRLINLCETSLESDKYDVAITKILGKTMEHIIVDTTENAVKCVHFLKQCYRGYKHSVVETFIPMDNLRKIREFDKKILENENNTCLAIDAMAVSEEYRDVLIGALRNVVICDTEDAALSLSKRKYIDCVSYNGTLYKKDGIFSGGLSDLQTKSKQKWNGKKLQKLKIEKEELLSFLRKTMTDLNNKESQRTELEIKLECLEKRLEHLQPLLKDARQALESTQKLLVDLEQSCDNAKIVNELKQLRYKFKIKTKDLEIMERKNQKIENQIFSDFCAMYQLENIQQYEMGDLNIYMERSSKLKEYNDHLNDIDNQIDYENASRQRSKSAVIKLQIDIEKTKKEYEELIKQNNILCVDEIPTLFSTEAIVKESTKKANELDTSMRMKKIEYQSLKKDCYDQNSKIKAIEARVIFLHKEKHTLFLECKCKSIDIPLVTGSLSTVSLNADHFIYSEPLGIDSSGIEEYIEIDYCKIPEHLNKDIHNHGVDNTIKLLQTTITSMREEIHKLSPKLKVTATTSNDINHIINTLKNAYRMKLQDLYNIKQDFNKIKYKRLTAFETFCELIEPILAKNFKMLFNNSSAQGYIIKTNPDEPYLGNLIFSCFVSQKRFRQIEDLSGGEKTMCSIALLSALNSVKALPFLIFDEIDAALDNTNINEVTDFFTAIKELKQIIVISHREVMSVCSDFIIGVHESDLMKSSCTCHIDVTEFLSHFDKKDPISKDVAAKIIAALKFKIQNDQMQESSMNNLTNC